MSSAANHWDKLATEAETKAAWDRDHGIDLSVPGSSPGDHRARLYRHTAESLRLEASTGVEHCVCHLVPVGRCPARKAR